MQINHSQVRVAKVSLLSMAMLNEKLLLVHARELSKKALEGFGVITPACLIPPGLSNRGGWTELKRE